MSKKSTRALASATLMSLVLTTALSAGPVKAAAGQVTRTSGADRYATAASVAKANWTKGATDVVLVSGEGYADAVSASALAKQLNAPILLTTAGSLSADAKSALETLKPTNVYIVGGNASVNQSVRDGLTASYKLVELKGANRYETNVAVAKKLVELGVKADNVLLVGGEGFSDALSVAPVAAAKGQILLLGNNNADSMKSVIDFVKTNNSKVTVVGTSNVISNDMYTAIGATDRVNGGASRFETNINVLNKFATDLKTDKLFVANASGNGYADALVASALAGKTASPLVLVDADGTTATANAISYIKGKATTATDLNVIGGTGVVSEGIVGQINNAVNPSKPGPGNTTVKSIEAVDLNQLRVTFATDVDSDSAEDVGNYKIDGSTLTTSDSTATLGDDNRTLLITLKSPREQQKEYTVAVKNGVLTADKTSAVDSFDQKVSFSDVTAPTVASLSVKGNSKITVNFTEPVKVPVNSGTNNPTNTFTSKFKINGQNISSFGLDTTATVVKHNIATTTGSYMWADRVDFYFSTKLPTGSNTLKVSDGTANDVLSDAAGFIVKEIQQDFTVDSVTTKPTIKEVKADTDNTIWVRFDRPMDYKTAKILDNYKLNNVSLNGKVAVGDIDLKEGDCTVKIKHVPDINFGSNTIYVSDSIKDAYGNKVDDDTRVNFTMTKDETKPTVTSVNMVDSETIRVKFSKDVDVDYATKVANYTLKDASNVDVSNHIRVVKPAYKSVPDTTTSGAVSAYITSGDFGDDSAWDIKLYKNAYDYHTLGKNDTYNNTQATLISQLKNDDWRLTGAKYTLIVKNLADTTANKNVMDDYTTTINGSDDVSPKMNVNAYRKSDHKVVVTFSEAMDGDQLDNLDNYKYKNGAGDSKQLPSDTKITVGNDDKSVTLELPDSYYIYDGQMTTADNGKSFAGLDNDNKVIGILASNLKDLQGNSIDSFNNNANVNSNPSGTFAYKDSTYRVEKDGDDVLVKVQFENAIDSDTVTDANGKALFTVAGQTPSSVSVNGSDVVLRFNKDDKATPAQTIAAGYTALGFANATTNATGKNIDKRDIIKLQGSNAAVVVKTGVKDITGAGPVSDYTVPQKTYDYLATPETTSDYWYATTNTGYNLAYTDSNNQTQTTTAAAVVITFDTQLDATYSGVKADDFRFTVAGSEVKAEKVVVKGNALVFLFAKDASTFVNNVNKNVSISLKNSTIDVEALRDANSNNAKYVPSTDDKTKTRDKNIGTDSIVNLIQ